MGAVGAEAEVVAKGAGLSANSESSVPEKCRSATGLSAQAGVGWLRCSPRPVDFAMEGVAEGRPTVHLFLSTADVAPILGLCKISLISLGGITATGTMVLRDPRPLGLHV